MKIKYYGHSCFAFKGKDVTVVTDPYDPYVGYDLPRLTADIVTVSHQHSDHNYLKAVKPGAAVVDTPGEHDVKGIGIKGYEVNHDSAGGSRRGKSIIFCMDIDGIRLCHLGDLGERLRDDVLEKIKGADVLFAPVGGFFTLEPDRMAEEIRRVSPRIVIPMHYAVETTSGDMPIKPVSQFVRAYGGGEELKTDEFDINPENLPDITKMYVMDFYNK